MKPTFLTLLLVLLLVQIGCARDESASPGQTVHERVLDAGKIRAAYAIYEPLCVRGSDGELAGIGVRILEEVGRRLDLEIEWTEEVGWGTIFEGLRTGRYDIFGVGVWQNGSRGRAGIFSQPFLYNAIKVWGRPGESELARLSDLDSPDVKISTQDGAMEDLIAKSDFPNAERVSLPQLSPWTDVLLNITAGKADVTFAEPSAVHAYLKNNPGTLVELFPERPVRVFPTCFAMKTGAFQFKSMIDSALIEMLNDGTIDKILREYEGQPDNFYRVAAPYRLPE